LRPKILGKNIYCNRVSAISVNAYFLQNKKEMFYRMLKQQLLILRLYILSKSLKPMLSLTAFRSFALFFFLFVFCLIASAQPGNDDPANAIVLTPSITCYATPGTIVGSNSSGKIGCITGNVKGDVWYKFVAQSTEPTISLSAVGSNFTNPGLQIFSSATLSNATSISCGTTTLTTSGLTVGSTYYVRVYSSSNLPASDGGFSVCVTDPGPPANDACSNAVTLSNGISNVGTVWLATASTGIPAGCATGDADDDVWYKFTTPAFANNVTINLSPVGSDLSTSGARIQMFTGTCSSLTSYACGTTGLTTAVSGNTTYYIRVYSAGTGSIGGVSSGSTFSITAAATGPTMVTAGKMNEVFQQTILSGSGSLQYPWEITYGPDDKLWITESRGYKVYRMDPNTGSKTTVLDLNSASTDLSAWGADSLRAVELSTSNWNTIVNSWPQGGLAGLAIHPNFGDGTNHDFVYISYVHRYLSTASGSAGIFFRNKIVRFTYNSGTGKLGAPAVVCDTIPGGQDHNSQRMIIASVTAGGTSYLFYASGDMGAGQYANRLRPQNAQNIHSYEGKILRFNLEPDSDGNETVPNAWIPNDNPYNTMLAKQSAVYSTGIRNNQGFAYDTLTNKLYGSSHGPYSDDEINIIEGFRNYGHPLIQGFVDGNYNGNTASGTNTSVSAGAPYTDNLGVSTCPPIGNEATNKATIDASGKGLYKDPLFSAYAASAATVLNIWQTNPGNASPAPGWPTEAWAGLDLYSHKLIPGWKRSLVAASLKWGRLVRLKLNADGTQTLPKNKDTDTVAYFNSRNRFRDLAFSPDGKDIFVIMDNNSTTSGPGSANPVVPGCAGCVQKYTFLGYADAGGKSTIDTSVAVTAGTPNAVEAGTLITIDGTNNNLWVPITGPDGNILAEIKANGNNLGVVTSSFYTNAGAVRENALKRLYLDRNITITPQTQPSSPVSIRLYLTANELNTLKNASNSKGPSGVSSISNVSIYKNNDGCGPTWANTATPAIITPIYAEAHGSNGFVLQADISSFSSFYFANTNPITLPLQLLKFKGALENNATHLQWETANETNTSHFVVERSIDGNNFSNIGTVAAAGNSMGAQKYDYMDYAATHQSSSTLYYRLKMVDLNGDFTYSKVITIVSKPSGYTIALYPNPIHDVLKVKLALSKAEQVEIQVTDMNGRIIYKESRFVSTGTNELKINTTSWPSQLYAVRVTGTNKNILAAQNVVKL
jgi:trimeric autotransporter adhesin